jgi:O-antigen biosynthesis protein
VADEPLVSVVTPTWQRHRILLERCIPSVQAQDYPNVQHVIVSDGPDPELASRLLTWQDRHPIVYGSLPEHMEDETKRVKARNLGCALAGTDLIAYIDDDDALRPNHVSVLVQALMEHPECGFAYSQMAWHSASGEAGAVGWDVPTYCSISTQMVMHRRELLEISDWGPYSPEEDWELISRWLKAGVAHVHVPMVTVDVWPSGIFGGNLPPT